MGTPLGQPSDRTQTTMLILALARVLGQNAKACIRDLTDRSPSAWPIARLNESSTIAKLTEGPYQVQAEKISNVPGLTQGGAPVAYIIYPAGADDETQFPQGSFPFLSFAHGISTFAPYDVYNAYGPILRIVASFGFIIMAAQTCPTPGKYCPQFYLDQLATIKAAQQRTLHPALKSADFSNIGVFGHSMGGMATLASATSSQHGVKAAVSMHPCKFVLEGPNIHVPIMLTAGSADTTCEDGCAWSQYQGARLLITCFLLPAACCLLPAACCLLPAACYLLPAACCLLPAAYNVSLPIAHCSSLITYY